MAECTIFIQEHKTAVVKQMLQLARCLYYSTDDECQITTSAVINRGTRRAQTSVKTHAGTW